VSIAVVRTIFPPPDHATAMTQVRKYTTQLQAGLGLLPETLKLLAIWEPGMAGSDLFNEHLS
jgi:hypothetical protein